MVREVNISELKTAPYNPRVELKPGMPEWEKLKNSIKELGFVQPIVWNKRTGNVVGGHQRLAVMISLGHESVPCSIVDLDEYDEKLLNLALNKIKGPFDYDKLEDLLNDFDREVAELSGFTADEIAVILASNADLTDEGDYGTWDDEDDEPIVGGSYVITLKFANRELASEWAAGEGYADRIKETANTTVIRIDE